MDQGRILIVDDDPLLRGLLSHRLNAEGFDLIAADHGGAVLEIARTQAPDLIVLDAMMPVTDGFEVLRRLRAETGLSEIPVIMLTALKREQDVVGALQLGAADYLVKPFIPDELVARIRRVLRDRTASEGPHLADRSR